MLLLLASTFAALSCKKENVEHTPTYSAAEIEAFKEMTVKGGNLIQKLPSFVGIYLTDTLRPHLTRMSDTIIKQLNEYLLNRVQFKRVLNRSESIIQVHFTGPNSLNTLGYATVSVNNGRIDSGGVYLDVVSSASNSLNQRRVYYHEFMHVLGFPGHVTNPRISSTLSTYVFYIQTGFSEFDEKMIRLLYSDAVQPGMNEQQVHDVISKL